MLTCPVNHTYIHTYIHTSCLHVSLSYIIAFGASLRDAIASLHDMVGNVETNGYTLVLATGGTQIIAAASWAIAAAAKRTMNVFAKIPHYNGYTSWANCECHICQFCQSVHFI
jgi:hypothetical protein